MKVYAVLAGGRRALLAAHHGATAREVIDGLTDKALTGSAVPLDDAELELADGGKITYGELSMLEEADSFLPPPGENAAPS